MANEIDYKFTPVDIEQIAIEISEKVNYFEDIKELNPIPKDAIIDKTLPGLGATYSEITAFRDSIIILPNVSTIISKHEQHKGTTHTLAIYEGISKSDITNYLATDLTYKKILTTPEGFTHKLKPLLGDSMYSQYFLLLDECHKFIMDSGYRHEITLPIDDFFLFKNKAMVSSTAIMPSDHRFVQQSFKHYKVVPLYNYNTSIDILNTNNPQQYLLDYLQSADVERHYIFFNSIQGIKSIVSKLIKNDSNNIDNYKIFCSKDSAKELKIAGFENANYSFDSAAKYNFLTSSFYNGVDIYFDGKQADVLMISDINYAPQSAMDIDTDVIQARGRFRKYLKDDVKVDWVNKFTHIINPDPKVVCMSNEEAIERIHHSKKLYQYINDFRLSTASALTKDDINAVLERVRPYANLLDDNMNLNAFKVDNYLLKERILNCYKNADLLLEAYTKNERFNSTYKKVKYRLQDNDRLTYSGGRYSPENYVDIINTLWECESEPHLSWARASVSYVHQHFPLIAKAYYILGVEMIHQLGYEHKLVMQGLTLAESLMGRNKFAVIDAVHSAFHIRQVYLVSDIKVKLQEIFDTYKVPVKAKGKEVQMYYDIDETQLTVNGKRHRAYRILRINKNSLYDRY